MCPAAVPWVCRRGYDVMAFALAGASYALGLDIIPQAVAAAEQEKQEQMKDTPPEVAARANFAQGVVTSPL